MSYGSRVSALRRDSELTSETDMVTRRNRSRRIGSKRIDLHARVDRLARMVEQIESWLRRAEQKIQADAEDRVRRLHAEAKAQLLALRDYEREARRILLRLSGRANDSWRGLERAADLELQNARKVADAIIKRCRRILSE